MSTLTLIRHGQAAPFLRPDSPLTPLGRQQAEALAHYWLRQDIAFTEVHSGALLRQIETEQIVAKCFRDAGRSWPDANPDPAWNEYTAPDGLPLTDDRRAFQRAFEAAMLQWLETPSWPAFHQRISGALAAVMQGPPSRRAAVFTSGGPIGFAVYFAMQAPPRSFLEVNWRVRNTSVTEFLFDRQRLTLDSFNNTAHLHHPDLRSYR